MPTAAGPDLTYPSRPWLQEYSFGDGLSYTRFELTHVGDTTPTAMSTAADASVQYTLRVKNVGARAGGATVLGFFRPRDRSAARVRPGRVPLRQKLFAFDGVSDLMPGTDRPLQLTLRANDLAIANVRGERIVAAGDYDVWFKIGSNQLLHAQTLRVHGTDRIFESYSHLE